MFPVQTPVHSDNATQTPQRISRLSYEEFIEEVNRENKQRIRDFYRATNSTEAEPIEDVFDRAEDYAQDIAAQYRGHNLHNLVEDPVNRAHSFDATPMERFTSQERQSGAANTWYNNSRLPAWELAAYRRTQELQAASFQNNENTYYYDREPSSTTVTQSNYRRSSRSTRSAARTHTTMTMP